MKNDDATLAPTAQRRRKKTDARETIYKGIAMRSRLEAAFAEVMLDGRPGAEFQSWEYEPGCFAGDGGQYLPDFRVGWKSIDAPGVVYFEVKNEVADAAEALSRMHIIRQSEPGAHLVVWQHDGEWPLTLDSGRVLRCSTLQPCVDCRPPMQEPHMRESGLPVCYGCSNELESVASEPFSMTTRESEDGVEIVVSMHYVCFSCECMSTVDWTAVDGFVPRLGGRR